MANKSNVAKELLAFEKRYRSGQLTDPEKEQWLALVMQLFNRDEPTARKSYRFPASIPGSLRYDGVSFPCTVREVAHTSFTVSGESFGHFAVGATVVLTLASDKGATPPLECTVVRMRTFEGEPAAGLKLNASNSEEARRKYFEVAYYPTYIRYLEEAAS